MSCCLVMIDQKKKKETSISKVDRESQTSYMHDVYLR